MDKNGSCGGQKGSCGGKQGEGSCCGKIIKAAVIGAIAMFAYMWVSWSMLPWHTATMKFFKDEAAVTKVLKDNTDGSGIYVMPQALMGKEVVDTTQTPFMFASVEVDGVDMSKYMYCMLKGFAMCLVVAGTLACLLKNVCACNCKCPVAFSMKVAFLVAVMHNVTSWNWWHFADSFTLVGMADDFIAITLAGWAMSKFVWKKGCGTTDKPACSG